jgi:D-alanyl-D-alanine carboxypeptidase
MAFFFVVSGFTACVGREAGGKNAAAAVLEGERPAAEGAAPAAVHNKLAVVLGRAGIPQQMAAAIVRGKKAFLDGLAGILAGDAALYALVDKAHPLSPPDYVPPGLILLTGGSYRVGRAGLSLRREAEEALEKMAAAARAEGVTIIVSSAYRSYEYQVEVYGRNVRQSGQETADRESARPGYSQHQTGLAADFGSITDEFAQTAAGKWMAHNASAFGWSLSFPDGYEELTGYRWESWHFRYAGVPLAAFIDMWFGGIQQYALQFIHEWNVE